MPDRTSLETRLTRAECDERLQGCIDRRAFTFHIDPARPVRGRSSISGFVLRHPRDAIVNAHGTYLLGESGGTRIDLRYGLASRSQLWWMSVNVVVLGSLGGVVLAGTVSVVQGDPRTVVLVSAALMGALVLALQLALIGLGWLVYGPRQRRYLRRFLEETLAAR